LKKFEYINNYLGKYYIDRSDTVISNFLVKSFVKNDEDTKNPKVRNSYGTLGGVIGIIINF